MWSHDPSCKGPIKLASIYQVSPKYCLPQLILSADLDHVFCQKFLSGRVLDFRCLYPQCKVAKLLLTYAICSPFSGLLALLAVDGSGWL